jgi:hypothetical protein
MLRILGCPPMNQTVAMAPLMRACFTDKPDRTPYRALPANVPLDRLNPKKGGLRGQALRWAERSLALDWSRPDLADEDGHNRILWHAVRGAVPYPREWAGAHGRGLPDRRLRHQK